MPRKKPPPEECIVGIYLITSPSKRKWVYVGHTYDWELRHSNYLKGHCKQQRRLWQSLMKYGPEKHTYDLIYPLPYDIPKKRIKKIEQAVADIYVGAGFRLMNMAACDDEGKRYVPRPKATKETRSKLSKTNKGKTHSAETKQRMSDAQIGVPKSPEHVAKMKNSKKGVMTNKMWAAAGRRKGVKTKPWTEQSRKKSSETKKNNYSEELGKKCSANAKKQWENPVRMQKHLERNRTITFSPQTRKLMSEKAKIRTRKKIKPIMIQNKEIALHGDFMEASYALTVVQQRFLYILASIVKPDDPIDKLYSLSLHEYEKLIGKKINHHAFRESFDQMKTQTFEVKQNGIQLPFFRDVKYNDGTAFILLGKELRKYICPFID